MFKCLFWATLCIIVVLSPALPSSLVAQEPAKSKLDTSRGDKMFAEYFQRETERLQKDRLHDIDCGARGREHAGGHLSRCRGLRVAAATGGEPEVGFEAVAVPEVAHAKVARKK